jgi:hypothetical protein
MIACGGIAEKSDPCDEAKARTTIGAAARTDRHPGQIGASLMHTPAPQRDKRLANDGERNNV